jgi:hypothetical protein
MDCFGEITTWHLGKLELGQILQMAETEKGIKWMNEES